jgi:hypothetical protein
LGAIIILSIAGLIYYAVTDGKSWVWFFFLMSGTILVGMVNYPSTITMMVLLHRRVTKYIKNKERAKRAKKALNQIGASLIATPIVVLLNVLIAFGVSHYIVMGVMFIGCALALLSNCMTVIRFSPDKNSKDARLGAIIHPSGRGNMLQRKLPSSPIINANSNPSQSLTTTEDPSIHSESMNAAEANINETLTDSQASSSNVANDESNQ